MVPVNSKFIQELHLGQKEEKKDFSYNENGMRFQRKFSVAGKSPFDMVEYEKRISMIREPDGTVVFEMKDIEIPKSWSQVATDIMAQKYFRKAGVPQHNADGTLKMRDDRSPVLGPETSAKQPIHRLAGAWRYWGEKYGYFASPEDAQIFYDETVVMLLRQMAAPNSPQWFNTGLHWAYGINGPAQGHYYIDPDTGVLVKSTDAYTRAQAHACFIQSIKDDLVNEGGIMDLWVREARLFKYGSGTGTNFSNLRGHGEPLSGGGKSSGLMSFLKIGDRSAGAIKSGGTTRRAAKMCVLDLDHPDIEAFINWKVEEEKKVAALMAAGYTSDYEGEAYQTVSGQNSNNSVRIPHKFMDALEHDGSWSLTWRTDGTACKTMKAKHLWDQVSYAAWACADPGVQYDGTINDWHTCPQSGRINASNPCCITGDTLVAVADGRNAVPIKELVGQEVPVYAHDHAKGRTTISRMWNIGIKRKNAPIFKVTLDDGSAFRATDDHLIMLRNGTYKKVKDLKETDSLMPFHSSVIAIEKNRTKRRYYWTGEGWEDEHNSLHSERMKGDANPARRMMNDLWRKHISEAVSGVNNPNYGHVYSEESRALMRAASANRWSKISEHIKVGASIKKGLARARKNGTHIGRPLAERFEKTCPVCRQTFQTIRENQLFCSSDCRYSPVAMEMIGPKTWNKNRGVSLSEDHKAKLSASVSLASDPQTKRRAAFVAHKNHILRAARLLLDNNLPVSITEWDDCKKIATNLGVSRVPRKAVVEKMFVSDKELVSHAKLYNHKVVSVEFVGMEDVYDGTVDGHHNFGIFTKSKQACVSGQQNYSGIFIHNSEYMFLDNSACNLASLNLAHFFDVGKQEFLVDSFKHATRIWTVILEISVLMAQFPSKEIAQMSYDFRTLGLGYANLGSVLLTSGIPYESDMAYGFAGSVTALMTGEAYKTSAEMAKFLGTFSKFDYNREDMLRVVRNHRRAAFNVPDSEYEKLTIKPVGINPEYAPAYLVAAARESWNEALAWGEKFGYRNAQTTLLAPTGTIGLLMDCATTGVEPDFALVKFKKLSGGGYFKIVNEAVPVALKNLQYTGEQIQDILDYMKGTADIANAPHINTLTLKAKGFTDSDLENLKNALKSAFEIQFAFNVWTLGEECMARVGIAADQYNDSNFQMLNALDFAQEQIDEANDYVCGTMTIEGAPHLKMEHYPVLDCANRCGKKGVRSIQYMGHVRMMAAVQPFLSGAISKTINMPNEVTVEDVKHAYVESWNKGLKAVALYRDGCKLSQPLSASTKKTEAETDATAEKVVVVETSATIEQELQEVGAPVNDSEISRAIFEASRILKQHIPDSHAMPTYENDGTITDHRIYLHGEKRKVPAKRSGITVAAKIGNQQIWLRTGEYPDGRLAEIFIDMYKEGAAFRSILNMFAISVSMGLQYGVPLEKYVNNFVFTRFEPAGMTDHPNIKICTSVLDFVFRVLGMEYLGRTDFVQVKPNGIQKNRFEKIAQLLETSVRQETMELKAEVGNVELENMIDEQEILPIIEMPIYDMADQTLSRMDGDAPSCPTCGHVTVRNGACYKCLNCGDSLGCS